MNWDDLRVVEALAAKGRFSQVAQELGVDETTVARRLRRLERHLGTALFEARDGGWVPSARGQAMLEHVGAIRRHIGGIEVATREGEGVSGRIRLATTPYFAQEILAPRMGEFLRAYPGLTLEVATSVENVDFARWEADLAIRMARPPRGNFTISRLGQVPLVLVRPRALAPEQTLVCAYPEWMAGLPEMQVLRAFGLDRGPRMVSDDTRTIERVVLAGGACAVLPAYVLGGWGETAALERVATGAMREVWLLAQPHLKQAAGAQAVIGWLRRVVAEALSPLAA